MDRSILLVDDEENILSSLARLLRRQGYKILRANSGKAGLEVLKDNVVGVIVSDQRMPEMTGVEFLGLVKNIYPDTTRIVLSGYTDLKSITDAINDGDIYKFLTKPWDDEILLKSIDEAFDRYEMKILNTRLSEELKVANAELENANRKLNLAVEVKTNEVEINMHVLRVSQDVLENLPIGIICIADDELIVITNKCSEQWLGSKNKSLIGNNAEAVLPKILYDYYKKIDSEDIGGAVNVLQIDDGSYFDFRYQRLSNNSESESIVIVMSENKISLLG